jgi:hypothetical protein
LPPCGILFVMRYSSATVFLLLHPGPLPEVNLSNSNGPLEVYNSSSPTGSLRMAILWQNGRFVDVVSYVLGPICSTVCSTLVQRPWESHFAPRPEIKKLASECCLISKGWKQRPILNFTPRGKVVPQGWILSPRGEFCPPGANFVPWVWSYPLGVKFSACPSILLNNSVHPWGWTKVWTFPLGD